MSALGEALLGELRQVVREELRAALGTRADDRRLSKAELAAALGLSAKTIARFDAQGLPSVGHGRLRRYDRAAVERWIGDRESTRQGAAVDELLARRGPR